VFFLGVARLITQNWVAVILVGVFVLFFSFFGLGLTSAASFSDDEETTKTEVKVRHSNPRPASHFVSFIEPKTTPIHK
jgi:hypothetical protein